MIESKLARLFSKSADFRRIRTGAGTAAVLGIACIAQFALHRATDLSIEPFFDEMWRIDGIFSDGGVRRVLENAAPLSPAWLFLTQVVGWVSESFTALRSWNMMLAAIGAALCSLAVGRRSMSEPFRLRACVATVGVLSTELVFNVSAYFNNYGWEIFVVGVLLFLTTGEDDRFPSLGLVPTALIAGLTLQGGLPLIASLLLVRFVDEWRRSATHTARIGSFLPLVGLGVGSVVNLLWAAGLQQADRTGDLTSFWGDEAFDVGRMGRSLGLLWRTGGEGFLPAWVDPNGSGRHVIVVLVAILALAGAVWLRSVHLRIVVSTALAIPILAVASLVTAGPFAVNRLTVGMFVPLVVVVIDVAVRCIQSGLARLRVPQPAAMVVVGSILVGAFLWGVSNTRSANDSPSVFARGLLADVRSIEEGLAATTGASPGRRLWVAYHPMSHWYVRYGLRMVGSPDHVVHETWDSQSLYESDDLRGATAEFEAAVCVVPYEAGPEGSARACPMSNGFTLVDTQRLQRAEFRIFVRATS